jgi:GTP cyclohydrolase I
MNRERVEELVGELLRELGEDPEREGLRRTPGRVARSLEFLLRGYRTDVESITKQALMSEEQPNMIVLKDIEIYSLCEHHLLPFFGRCHVGYIGRKRVIGVSKIARLAEAYARRLQVQERLTQQIARALMTAVDAEGVGVVIEARHLCMMMRGVEKQNAHAVTSSMLGRFRSDIRTREEFLDLIKKR